MTPTDAPYKLAQRVQAEKRPLATSAELRKFQEEHKESALAVARRLTRGSPAT